MDLLFFVNAILLKNKGRSKTVMPLTGLSSFEFEGIRDGADLADLPQDAEEASIGSI